MTASAKTPANAHPVVSRRPAVNGFASIARPVVTAAMVRTNAVAVVEIEMNSSVRKRVMQLKRSVLSVMNRILL
ncbi:hypothetical protein C2R22_24485 (plasmid) [Salinigranum rubrum]|uniref:Uncharacterized protein n=1 Tax=Salinigranum rubrum TaxID=755307 RepID=A0A2I8VU32_9EURY|nr:hypothetical protein C2R22_24485 [Salinigranum rubrum]